LPQQKRHGQTQRRVERNFDVERKGFERGVNDEAVVDAGQCSGLRVQVEGESDACRDDRASGVERFVREESELPLCVARDARRDRGADGDDARAELRRIGEDVTPRVTLFGGTERERGFLSGEAAQGELAALRLGERDADGAREKIVDVIGDEPAAHEGDEDEDDGADEATAQFVQMVEKGHLAAEPPVLRLAVCVA
jgi:hypothetical protein